MMLTTLKIDPTRIFEIKQQVCSLTSVYKGLAVGANQLVVAAIAGSRIRVMGAIIQTLNAAGSAVIYLSASGGTVLTYINTAPLLSGPIMLPITETGYFETNTGEGLYATIVTNDCNITTFYITYAP